MIFTGLPAALSKRRYEMLPEELKAYADPDLQRFFAEKMGPWQEGDPYNDPKNKEQGWAEEFCVPNFNYGDVSHCLRLPLPIDPRNPERGLVGMLSDFYKISTYGGRWAVSCFGNPPPFFYGKTPTLALLRALKAQIGGK
jgi:hypothetical protein